MATYLVIAALQLNSNDCLERNFLQIEKLLEEVCQLPEKPALVFLPENSIYYRINTKQSIPHFHLTDLIFVKLQNLSEKFKISIHLTNSLFFEGKNWNASVLIKPFQKIEVIYKKIHLFDIHLDGEKSIKESDIFFAGTESSVFSFGGFKFGSSICYDLRFSKLFHLYAEHEVDVILVPAAFLAKTGRAHWEPLLRARAIESQCYVIAPAQAGLHTAEDGSARRETYGHSLIVDPWGVVITSKADGIGFISAGINTEKCTSVRNQIPMKLHRRL